MPSPLSIDPRKALAALVAIFCLTTAQPGAADDATELAERLCGNGCHTTGQLGQSSAAPLEEMAPRVDWSNIQLREWMAANHRFVPALAVNAAELEALRRHLDSLRRQSFLGGMGSTP